MISIDGYRLHPATFNGLESYDAEPEVRIDRATLKKKNNNLN